MNLSELIRLRLEDIIARCVEFARTLEPLSDPSLDEYILRDNFKAILQTIAMDLEQSQTRLQGDDKARGSAPVFLAMSAAQKHGGERAGAGLSITQAIAEYRVLRSVILQMWMDGSHRSDDDSLKDLIRFNEAIDQAIVESLAVHDQAVSRWRNMLLSVISHDLRGTVHAVQMSAELLSMQNSQISDRRPVDRVVAGSQRMGTLLDSLLDYSMAGLGSAMELHKTTVDLEAACRSEIDLIQVTVPDTRIVVDVRGNLVGDYDESRVREALANLVSNALQYRETGTPIRVKLAGDSDAVELEVANKGKPIGPEVLSTLFEPLRRYDTEKRHTNHRNLGVGLFIVREIARAHEGTVSAESRDGDVLFRMRLPKRIAKDVS